MKSQALKFADGHYEPCNPEQATHLRLRLPGPTGDLILPVLTHGTREGTGCWTWNGDLEKPTLKPSVLHTSGHFVPGFDAAKDTCWCKYFLEHPEEEQPFKCFLCHVWINDGKVQFLGDCSHELVGQTVDLLDVES